MKYMDEIIASTQIRVGLMDRIRILFGKTIYVSISTKTENLPGHVKSESKVSVGRFIKPNIGTGGYEEDPTFEEG